jgi:glycosyltransferase involved in cell wall biosynthesis
MNLLIFTENHVFGGGNKYMINFINALNNDHNIILVTNKNGLSKNELNQINCKTLHYELNLLSYDYLFKNYFVLRIIFKFYSKFFNFGKKSIVRYVSNRNIIEFENLLMSSTLVYDFVFAFNGGLPGATSCLDLLHVTAKHNIKSVISIVSMPMKNNIFTNYYLNTLKNIDYFIVNCFAIKKSLFDNYNITKNKIYIIPQFVDLPHTYNNKLQDSNILKLGFVGRIEKGKGIFILLKAFNNLTKKNKNISLEIYGKNYLKFWQKIYIYLIFKNSSIQFKGSFTSIEQVYNSIDLLILPSLWEGLPFVILESMSFGVPVIASDVGGISEVVIPNYNGHLVEKNSFKSLYDVLDDFEINSYTFYSNNSRKFIKENFTKKSFDLKIDYLFTELIKNKHKS